MVFKLPFVDLCGLEFESESDYKLFKDLDDDITKTIKQVKNEELELGDVFKDVKPINVKELYYSASYELSEIFPNVSCILNFDEFYYKDDFKIACKFFDKIKIAEFKVDNDEI